MEYREVSRRARNGELVKIVSDKMYHHLPVGSTHIVDTSDGSAYASGMWLEEADGSDRDYVVLEAVVEDAVDTAATKTIVHNGQTYRVSDRKPQIGDFVWYEKENRFAKVVDDPLGNADIPNETYLMTALDHDAVVLEQVVVESEMPASAIEKTIVHNGQTYKTVSRNARVGNLIQVTEHEYRPETVGAIVTVKYARPDGRVFYARPSLNAGKGSRAGHYVVLERIDDAPKDADRIITLEATVKSLTERVAALESKNATSTDFVSRWEALYKPNESKITKLTRADVVEQAKKDVEEIVSSVSGERTFDKYSKWGRLTVEFVIDRKKRMVTALTRGYYTGVHVFDRGVAQCAPDDCFNVHIGKAIAVRRALGLEIPSEYVNAPKPTEVSVGDVVTWPKWNTSYYIVKVHGNDVYDFRHVKSDEVYGHKVYENLGFNESNVLVDDSHDFGGQER